MTVKNTGCCLVSALAFLLVVIKGFMIRLNSAGSDVLQSSRMFRFFSRTPMDSVGNTYTVQANRSPESLDFFFISQGAAQVIKVITYSFVEKVNGIDTYNLGFGDVDFNTKIVRDNTVTGNGDARKVFHTVLKTVPMFFEQYPNHKLVVKGSDSRTEFVDECRRTCNRKCSINFCRKSNQRIRIYRNFVDSNFSELNAKYRFFGRYDGSDGQMKEEEYIPGRDYISIAVIKRNHNFIL